jgi:phage-related tail protein
MSDNIEQRLLMLEENNIAIREFVASQKTTNEYIGKMYEQTNKFMEKFDNKLEDHKRITEEKIEELKKETEEKIEKLKETPKEVLDSSKNENQELGLWIKKIGVIGGVIVVVYLLIEKGITLL